MKVFAILLAACALTSCNTLIGIGRDTKIGYQWTRDKIQGASSGSGQQDYGAPVY